MGSAKRICNTSDDRMAGDRCAGAEDLLAFVVVILKKTD
jgi:hypothetical protein